MSIQTASAVLPRKTPWLQIFLLLGGATAVALSPIFVRLSELQPSATGVWRTGLSLPVLFIWMAMSRRRTKTAAPAFVDIRILILPGLLFAGDLFFWHWSIAFTSVANATLFANFAPLFVALGAWLIFKQRVSARLWIGILVAISGAGLMLGESIEAGSGAAFGDFLGIITAFFFGAYMLTVSRLRGRLDSATLMFHSSWVTCAALLLIAIVSGEALWPRTAAGWLNLLALSWLTQALGQGLIAYSLGHLAPAFAALVILMEPVAAALFGWVFLGEGISLWQVMGGGLMMAGVLWARRET